MTFPSQVTMAEVLSGDQQQLKEQEWLCINYLHKTPACYQAFLEHWIEPFLVWVHSDPESGQTQGGHPCPTWVMKAFTKNKAKQINNLQAAENAHLYCEFSCSCNTEIGDWRWINQLHCWAWTVTVRITKAVSI